jgi:molybdate transport system substrate-binding protein
LRYQARSIDKKGFRRLQRGVCRAYPFIKVSVLFAFRSKLAPINFIFTEKIISIHNFLTSIVHTFTTIEGKTIMKVTTNQGVKIGVIMAFICIGLLLVCVSCGKEVKSMLFHAGVGQRSSLDEIGELFQKRNPGVRVDFAYKGSGYLLSDITISKQGDLYMPGEESYMVQAVDRGLVSDYNPKTDIPAYFVTVIITPKGNPKNIHSLSDFAAPGVRVGVGDAQACAIGQWHEKVFKKAGIWDAVRKNVTMNAKCIPELGNACQLKAIDATIVWATTAALYLKDIEILPIDPHYRGIISLPVGILKFSKYPKEARRLKDFILSEEVKTIFHDHAYCIDTSKVDEDIQWLMKAAKVAKDPSIPVTEETTGYLTKEVTRQRETKK